MDAPTDLASLTELFRKLGASHPEAWAKSQLEEGLPQLSRFLFLREAWKRILAEDDPTWVESYVRESQRRPNEPYSGIGRALETLRAKGATHSELTDLVRGMQAELLFGLCYQLDGHDAPEPEVSEIRWQLFQTDGRGTPTRRIGALHESVLETDPTGREMRPRR